VSAVKRLCRSIRRARGVRPEDVAIPLETEPGQEAQVDFGYVGQLYDPVEGRLRKAYVFVMVLSHSRHQFARICFDQKVETWLLLHIEAFEHFGAVLVQGAVVTSVAVVQRDGKWRPGAIGGTTAFARWSKFGAPTAPSAPPGCTC
jgi:hypothetical protein